VHRYEQDKKQNRGVIVYGLTTQKTLIWAPQVLGFWKIIWGRNSLLLWHQTVNHHAHKFTWMDSIPWQINLWWQGNPRNVGSNK